MRSFIITAFLFLLMLCIIFFNMQYVRKAADYIRDCVSDSSFEKDAKEAVKDLENFWNDNISKISLSVGYKEIDRMSELIIDLKAYVAVGNLCEINRTRDLIAETASDISRLEKFHLENMF